MSEEMKAAKKSGSHEKIAAEQWAYRKEREGALQEFDAKLDELKKKTLDLAEGTRQGLEGAIQGGAEGMKPCISSRRRDEF